MHGALTSHRRHSAADGLRHRVPVAADRLGNLTCRFSGGAAEGRHANPDRIRFPACGKAEPQSTKRRQRLNHGIKNGLCGIVTERRESSSTQDHARPARRWRTGGPYVGKTSHAKRLRLREPPVSLLWHLLHQLVIE